MPYLWFILCTYHLCILTLINTVTVTAAITVVIFVTITIVYPIPINNNIALV